MTEGDKTNIPTTTSIHALIKKASEIYEGLKGELEPAQNGRFVAIEIESGEHFLGDSREEASAASRVKYPEKVTFTKKIGEEEKAARHSHPRQGSRYAGIL